MLRPRTLARAFYRDDSVDLAPKLLNKLMVTADGRAGRIIEVEAYRGDDDPASHAFKGRTARNRTMFGPPGHLYVYLSYGVHWCANVVCGQEGQARALLIRALDPVAGIDQMRAARGDRRDRDLCRGPGRLCQALGIDRTFDGTDLVATGSLLWLADDGTPSPGEAAVGPRIGISVAAERPWRFSVPAHPGVSGPSRPQPRTPTK